MIKLSRPTLILAGLFMLLLVGVGIRTFINFNSASKGGWGAGGPMPVNLLTLQAHSVLKTYETQGSVASENQVDLKPEITGTVSALHFTEGESVNKGAVLVQLQSDRQTAQMQEARATATSTRQTIAVKSAAHNQAEAELIASQARLALAKTEYDRYESLRQKQFVSELEVAQKLTQYETAKADYQVAQKKVELAHAEFGQARQNYVADRYGYRYNMALAGQTVIRAPFRGIVGQKYVSLGDTVSPGQKLLTLVQGDDLKIVFEVPEHFLNAAKMGAIVTFTLESQPDVTLQAKTVFIDPAVDAESRTLTVKALILPGQITPKPGQFAKVKLVLGENLYAVTVPEDTLVPQGEKFFVFLNEGGKAVLREVKTGQRDVGQVEILSGLKAGDQVVANGLQKITDGQPIIDAATLPKAPSANPGAPGGKP